MSRLWKTCKLMSHHEYSYQASGMPLLLISNHQWGAVHDQYYLKTNLPYSKPHLCNQLWYQKSLCSVIYSRDHLWSFWDGPCSLEVTMENRSLLPLSYFQLCYRRANKQSSSGPCSGCSPTMCRTSMCCHCSETWMVWYPKAAVVWNWRFFLWAHSHTSSSQSWCSGSCCVQGAAEWTDVSCHEIVECVENLWKGVSWPCFPEQKMAFPMVEILAEHSFSKYWAKVSGLMGLLKGRACVTSGAMKFCSCISPFCAAAQHARYGENGVHWKEGLGLQSHATSQA